MKRLQEIDIIRVFSMIFIVLIHSLALYSGVWIYPNNETFVPIETYRVIARVFANLSLPTFVFISGYLFSHGAKKNLQSISKLFIDKFKRLIIPSLFFGIFYIFIFFNDETITSNILRLTNGAGHLWFLPMLFWNYIFGFFLKKYELKNKTHKILLLLLLFCIAIIGSVSVPNILGISKALQYIPYFYLGLEIYNYRDNIIGKLNYKHLVGIISLYVIVFVFNEVVLHHINNIPSSIYTKLYRISYKHLLSIGIVAFFLIILFYTEIRKPSLDKGVTELKYINILAKYSFGIYIYHQFILKYCIYYLHIHEYLDYRIAPLVFFIIAFSISLLLTNLTLKTKVGRYLIG